MQYNSDKESLTSNPFLTNDKEMEKELAENFFNIFFRTPINPEEYFSPNVSQEEDSKIEQNFKYFYSFYKKKEKTYFSDLKEFLQKTPPQFIEEKNNIRVLIIIGSQLILNEKDFLLNYQYFITAFLIKHIFQHVYNIPKEHILITTSNKKYLNRIYQNPQYKETDERLESKTKNSHIIHFYNHWYFYCYTDFSFRNILISQVANTECKFITLGSEKWYKLIIPFNRQFLKSLNTDENSNVFIFFLDDDEIGSFVDIDYQFFIERFLELNAKQYIVFNESLHSGSLIELIRISEKLSSNFLNQIQLPEIFKELLTIAKEVKEKTKINSQHLNETSNEGKDDQIKESEILEKLFKEIKDNKFYIYEQNQSKLRQNKSITSFQEEERDEEFIEQKLKEALSKYSLSTSFNLSELIKIVHRLSEFSILHPINPTQFIEFKNKSTIFCSAPFNRSSISLPIQFIHCKNKHYFPFTSSHGTFFTSAIIQCLLNPQNEFLEPSQLAHQIQTNFTQLVSLFKDILISQIKIEEKDFPRLLSGYGDHGMFTSIKRSLEDYEEILQYFQTNYKSEETFITGTDLSLPNMRKLTVPKNYWCLNEYKLPLFIYKGLKFFDYEISILKHENQKQQPPE